MICSARQGPQNGHTTSRRSLSVRIGVALLSRIVISISRRFAYPFAPALSRGLGVEITAITSMVALNQATALLGLALAPLSDKFGYRQMMLAGLFVLGLGMFCGGLAPAYTTIMLALFFAGLGKNLFDPAIQGYVSERVPLHRRGQIVGLLETSWALGTLLGLPLIGLLMQEAGWRSPFLALGGMAIFCVGLAMWLVPGDKFTPSRSLVMHWGLWPSLLRRRAVLGILGYAFFTGMAIDSIFVVSGVWLEKNFHLSLAALGTGIAVIGAAELVGESLIAVIGDRLGLRRSMVAGTAFLACANCTLPLLGGTLALALTGLFLVFVLFEFSLVACKSLITAVAPGHTATVMSGFLTMAAAGRVVGVILGVPVWQSGGLWGTGIVAAVLSATGMFCASVFLPKNES